MKIAIIRKKYNPYGGAERYLNLLSTSLTRSGHEVHVYANQWSKTVDSHVTVHHVPMLGGLSLLKVWSFALAALAIVKPSEYDAILSNERLLSHDVFRVSDGVHRTWLGMRRRHAGWLKRLSFVVNPLHWSVRFLDWRVFSRRRFRTIIAPSEFIKQDILATYPRVRPDDVRVVYNGVDLERFRPENKARCRDDIRRQLGLGADQPVLLFVGTGFERKGLRYAVEALRHLPADMVLLVVGNGSTRRYHALARTWGVADRVLFLGPREGAEAYYAASDVLVFPTLYEPMGNVILEALASGIPVVTSRRSGGAEILTEGKDGWLIDEPTDAREVALRVLAAMKGIATTDVSRQARMKAEKFDLSTTVARLLDVLAGTSDRGRGRHGDGRVLFLLEGKTTPSSRLRIESCLPYLERSYRCVEADIPKSVFARLWFYWNLPRVDIVVLQKKLLRRWELAVVARKGRRLLYDVDDAVIYRNSEDGSRQADVARLRLRLQRIVERTNSVIVGNSYLADMVSPWSRDISILPTAVDLSRYAVKPAPVTTGSNVVVGWVGTRGNLKYLAELAPVWRRLSATYPNVTLKVVSDAELQLEGVPVLFERWRLDREVEALQSFDIGVMPLRDTPWTQGKCGYKILQYMAVGVPAVASPVGFNRTLIEDGVNGFLPTSPDQWYTVLARLIEDHALRREIGLRGRRTVEERFSLERYAADLSRVLDHAMACG
ncbi:MAG: glycosyltransferase family 4 protein [Nitrospirota bacterium]